MTKKINLVTAICCIALVSLFSSCNKESLQAYTGGSTAGFWIHSTNHSLYGMTAEEMPFDTITLDIATTGFTSKEVRYVAGTFIPDPAGTPEEEKRNTAVEGQDYKIIGGVVEPGEIYGKFRVQVINSDRIADKELKLNLSIAENDDFSVGLAENKSIVISFSQLFLMPKTFHAMSYFFCETYSTQMYKVFMEATGLKEFYYFEGEINQEEGIVMGRKFGDIIRQYEIDNGTPMLHDDGSGAGTPIIPIY